MTRGWGNDQLLFWGRRTGEDDKEFVDMEKQKVKLYVKKEASEPWADRGVNRLQFRREKGDAKGACRILMRGVHREGCG